MYAYLLICSTLCCPPVRASLVGKTGSNPIGGVCEGSELKGGVVLLDGDGGGCELPVEAGVGGSARLE